MLSLSINRPNFSSCKMYSSLLARNRSCVGEQKLKGQRITSTLHISISFRDKRKNPGQFHIIINRFRKKNSKNLFSENIPVCNSPQTKLQGVFQLTSLMKTVFFILEMIYCFVLLNGVSTFLLIFYLLEHRTVYKHQFLLLLKGVRNVIRSRDFDQSLVSNS